MEARFRGRLQEFADFDLPITTGFDRDRSKKKYRADEPRGRLLWLAVPVIFLLIVGSFCTLRWVDSSVPEPLTLKDIDSHPTSFIEERARNELEMFVKFGPRVCGSHANDIAAVELLVRLIHEIERTKNAAHKIQLDVQKTSGSFFMAFQEGLTSTYNSVPIVVTKLEPANHKTNHSILINCHFDSVAGSPGASDDMVNCASMLEVLRVLSRQSTPLKNSIVFLFNGAEENGMQASHGFVAGRLANKTEIGHPWAADLRAFINLEASGAGGKQVLFQTGPGNGWLMNSVLKSPHPYGSVIGEEIFQRGLIPSDTDFRVFRDHANIPGLDYAFIKNGWAYHTKHDNMEAITPGSIQQSGENLLAIATDMANLDYDHVEYSDEKMVYYDVFGLIYVVYTEKVSMLIHLFFGAATVYFAWFEAEGRASTIFYNVVVTLIAWAAGVVAAVSLGVVLNLLKFYTPFFSYPWLALVLYGIPVVVAQVAVFSYLLCNRQEDTWMAGKTTIGLVLVATTFVSRAFISLPINIGFGITGWYTGRKLFRGRDPLPRLAYYLTVGELFPLTLALYLTNNFVDVFVPIMGRCGTEAHPNIFVAVLTAAVLTIPTMTGIVPIFVFLRKTFYKYAAVLFVAVLGFIFIGIGRVPYTEKTPMRLHLVEVDRTWYDHDLTTIKKAESGFWFFNLDPNVERFMPVFQELNPAIKDYVTIESDQCDDLYCGLPYYFPVVNLIKTTEWLPKSQGLSPELKGRLRMDIQHDSFISPTVRRLSFSFVGPDHMTVVLSPGKYYKLSGWSLTKEIPPTNIMFKNRPSYFVYHGRGINFERFEFTIELTRKSAEELQNDGIDESEGKNALDITFSGYWLHGEAKESQNLKAFLSKFPEWVYALGWSAVTNVYKIA